MSEKPLKIKVYAQPAEFLAEVGSELENDRTMNNLMIGLASRFANVSPKGCLRQVAAWDGGTFAGAAMLSSPNPATGNFIVTAADAPVREALANDVLKAIRSEGLVFTGVVGEETTVQSYGELFKKDGYAETGAMGQGTYCCRQVTMPTPADSLTVRLATAADTDFVSDWFEVYILEALGVEKGAKGYEARDMAEMRIAEGHQWLAERQDGEVVAMAGSSRVNADTACVNGVFTPKACRRQGFGSYITAVVTEEFLAMGKDEVHLYTDLANLTSNKIYQNIGYEFVGNSRHIYLRPKESH